MTNVYPIEQGECGRAMAIIPIAMVWQCYSLLHTDRAIAVSQCAFKYLLQTRCGLGPDLYSADLTTTERDTSPISSQKG